MMEWTILTEAETLEWVNESHQEMTWLVWNHSDGVDVFHNLDMCKAKPEEWGLCKEKCEYCQQSPPLVTLQVRDDMRLWKGNCGTS